MGRLEGARVGTLNPSRFAVDTHRMKRWWQDRPSTMACRAIALVLVLAAALLGIVMTAAPASALTTATQVSSGGRTVCAVMTGGSTYCWGDNTYGQLGNGTTTSSPTPVLVSGGYTWASISTLFNNYNNLAFTCGVTTAGAGYCWGDNTWGELGNGGTTSSTTPVLVSGGYTWASISVGMVDACGVTTSGAGYCWGGDFAGEVGDGTSGTQRNSPTAVAGGYTWASISQGGYTTCGVTTAHVGYCWGQNCGGDVGDGTTTERDSPALVSGGYSWSSITTGNTDSCGVTTTNVGYCWGYNYWGEVGDGTSIQRNSPTPVSGGYVWSTISAGDKNTCGLTTSGLTYCWGDDVNGELGNGVSGTWSTTPVAVSGGYSFSSVVANGDMSQNGTNCGLAKDGIIYCWGYNAQSQVGDGTTTNRSVPTEAFLLFASVDNTTLSVTVDPTFTFTVANQASACNGESNFVSGAGGVSTVALGHLAAGANVSGGQALTVAGNAGGGFAVYVRGTQASQDLRSAGHNWADVSGSYASSAVLGAGERFGYTYKDSTASSSVTNPASANFVALTNATTNVVMGSTSSLSGSGCISYDAQTSATTPAASYTATVIYTAVPAF